jgi:hypothetical protein
MTRNSRPQPEKAIFINGIEEVVGSIPSGSTKDNQ